MSLLMYHLSLMHPLNENTRSWHVGYGWRVWLPMIVWFLLQIILVIILVIRSQRGKYITMVKHEDRTFENVGKQKIPSACWPTFINYFFKCWSILRVATISNTHQLYRISEYMLTIYWKGHSKSTRYWELLILLGGK